MCPKAYKCELYAQRRKALEKLARSILRIFRSVFNNVAGKIHNLTERASFSGHPFINGENPLSRRWAFFPPILSKKKKKNSRFNYEFMNLILISVPLCDIIFAASVVGEEARLAHPLLWDVHLH